MLADAVAGAQALLCRLRRRRCRLTAGRLRCIAGRCIGGGSIGTRRLRAMHFAPRFPEAAAKAAGLHYVHIPVVSGAITVEQVQAMRDALQAAPQPVLAFCRSGARSAQLFALTQG